MRPLLWALAWGLEPGGDRQYGYAWRERAPRASRADARASGLERFAPRLSDPNYLGLVSRRSILDRWIADLPSHVRTLDVGGRIQPWRALLAGRDDMYVAIDPIPEGLVDVVGVGKDLPFADESFDLVICTQALGYINGPKAMCREVRRVLVPGGVAIYSVPALLPRYHDCRWSFMPDGLSALLEGFEQVEIVPEESSFKGFFHLFNLFLDSLFQTERARHVLARTLFPVSNLAGRWLGRLTAHTEFSTGYCCRATKPLLSHV